MNTPPANLRNFDSLLQIMHTLRSPTGCPWDKAQTHKSIAKCAIEEVFELIDAIETNNIELLKEELGDVLLQVIFHSQMAKEAHNFDILDVIEGLNTKLVTRHPHVFGNVKASNQHEALEAWHSSKDKESDREEITEFKIPTHLPALQRAHKIGSKTKKLKFDWSTTKEVFANVEEELLELKEAIAHDNPDEIEEELGDVLFTLAQYARHSDFDAESVLRKANRKFEDRFFRMLNLCKEKDLHWDKLSLVEKEQLWQEIKLQTK